MMPDFTVEEKAFVQSVRVTAEGTLERIPCIRTISYLMARANTHDDGSGAEQAGDDDGCGVLRLRFLR